MDAAWLAIVGTLVGAGLTFVFQRLNASRAEGVARSERLRDRRIEAFSNYAEKLMDWRRTQSRRSSIPLQGDRFATAEADAICDENRRARAAAWTAYFHVKLLIDDAELEKSARLALDATGNMKAAETRAEIDIAGDEARGRLEAFLVRAADQAIASRG